VDVRCTAIDHYVLGVWIRREEFYDPYRYFGTVDDCDSASGVLGAETEYDTPIYTPDDYTTDDSRCGTSDRLARTSRFPRTNGTKWLVVFGFGASEHKTRPG
jgi:hypothetical protein